MENIIGFLLCSVIIFFAGKKLVFFGNLLSELLGLSKIWFGVMFTAAITSLPELIVGISSSVFIENADLAVGDILGSCAFNFAILALIDGYNGFKKTSLLYKCSQEHILSLALGIILISIVGIGLILPKGIPVFFAIEIITLFILIIYLVSIRLLFFSSKEHNQKNSSVINDFKYIDKISFKKVAGNYFFFGIIIVVAAFFLAYFADHVSEFLHLNKSFVGSFFVAASTSLPEVAVSVFAIRIGARDIALGNLFGSNIFNIFILFVDDLFYEKGYILQDASDKNLFTVIAVVIMAAIAIIGLVYKKKLKILIFGLDTLLIFFVYIINLFLFLFFYN